MLTLKVKAKGIDSGDLGDVLGLVAESVRAGNVAGKGSGWSYRTEEGRPYRPPFFGVRIETDNEAFSGRGRRTEVARILRAVADKLEREALGLDAFDGDKLRDVNGNTVGRVTVRKARKAKRSKA